MERIVAVKAMPDFDLWIRFSDGYEVVLNLKHLLGQGISEDLLKPGEFEKVRIESGGGLVWDNGFDSCPNFLRDLARQQAHVA